MLRSLNVKAGQVVVEDNSNIVLEWMTKLMF